MLELKKIKDDYEKSLTITLKWRLDTTTSPLLERQLKASLNDIFVLILDFTNLEYISSAGLRVVLAAQKVMNTQGEMIVKNVSSEIMDIFEVTSFLDILTIQND